MTLRIHRVSELRDLLRKGPGHQLSVSVEQDGRQATFRIKIRPLL